MQSSSNKKPIIITSLSVVAALLLIGGLILLSNNHTKNSNRLAQQQKEFAATPLADPILKFLPYGSTGYNITSAVSPAFDSANPKPQLVIKISVILYESDYSLNSQDLQTVITQRQQAALAYIKSSGFDPSKYNIQYYVPPH